MTFNIDPVGAALITIALGIGYRAWDRTHKRIGDNHDSAMKQLADYHGENKAKLKELIDEKDAENGTIHQRLDKHGEQIDELQRDVDLHGYRLSVVEKDHERGH